MNVEAGGFHTLKGGSVWGDFFFLMEAKVGGFSFHFPMEKNMAGGDYYHRCDWVIFTLMG